LASAVIDDVGVEIGQVKVGDRLDQQEGDDDDLAEVDESDVP